MDIRNKCETCTNTHHADTNDNTNGSTTNKQSQSTANSLSSGVTLKCIICDNCANEIEQCFHCLFGYRKPRVKYIASHSVVKTDYTLDNCLDLYAFFKPTEWPEFDSVKKDSISAEVQDRTSAFYGFF
jgi:hypothetical protein